jgi:hypothetical protein
LFVGIWLALPARWLWVDLPGTLLAFAALIAGVSLFARTRWSLQMARAVLWAELLIGSLTVTLLAAGVAQLAGSYGPVGAGGAILLVIVALLVVPYLIVFPALQLSWLREPG